MKESYVYIHASYIVFLIVKTENNNFIKKQNKLPVPSRPGENLGKVCENSWAGENPRLRPGFSMICSRILPIVRLGFHQAMKARRTRIIS